MKENELFRYAHETYGPQFSSMQIKKLNVIVVPV